MRDAFDVMAEAGAVPGQAVAARLADADTLARDVERVRAARRKRTLAGGAAGTALAVVVGAGAWAASGAGQVPAGDVAQAPVQDVPVFDARADRSSCVPSPTPQAYVPWADAGVSVASDEARATQVTVEGSALVSENADLDSLRRVEPGTRVDVPGSPSEGGSLTVDFDVTWAGDALYTVDAAAFLVASGRVLSPAVGWYGDAEDREVSGAGSAVPRYDPQTNTSSVSLVSPVQPTCLTASASSTWTFGAPSEASQLHTVVQVKDESGLPLATFVDGAGLDGTTVLFPGFLASGAVGSPLTQPTPADAAEVRAAREASAATVPSAPAVVRDAVAADGVPLSQAGAGIRLSGRCEVLAARIEQERTGLSVVPVDDDRLAAFPRELPMETVRGSRSVDVPRNPGAAPLRGSYTLVLLDPGTGAVEAWVPLQFVTQSDGGPTTALAGTTTSCTDRDIAPGDYQGVMVDPDDRSDAALDLADTLQPVTARWYDLGAMTVLP